MSAALILYGSRARGEIRELADVDLILADDAGGLRSPCERNGVSVHRYPKPWLMSESNSGSLFVYHVAFEGVALIDEDDFPGSLRLSFKFKSSYETEIQVAGRALSVLTHRDWTFEPLLRRRFFWALRSIIISHAADAHRPVFSANALESYTGVEGLADLLNRRVSCSFEEAVHFGRLILDRFRSSIGPDLPFEKSILYLKSVNEIGRDTVRLVEIQNAKDIGNLAIYA